MWAAIDLGVGVRNEQIKINEVARIDREFIGGTSSKWRCNDWRKIAAVAGLQYKLYFAFGLGDEDASAKRLHYNFKGVIANGEAIEGQVAVQRVEHRSYIAGINSWSWCRTEVAKTARERNRSWVARRVVGAQWKMVVRNTKFKVEGV